MELNSSKVIMIYSRKGELAAGGLDHREACATSVSPQNISRELAAGGLDHREACAASVSPQNISKELVTGDREVCAGVGLQINIGE